MTPQPSIPKLVLLPQHQYRGVNQDDPLRYYYWPIIGQMYRHRVELCLHECRGGDKILEVGFGSGLSFINLNQKYAEIHGLDLTAEIEEVAEVFTKLDIHTELQQGDVLDMPYGDDTFDTVLLISILEHLNPADLKSAFKEIHRVLKPGGQLVYGVPVERPFMAAMFRVLGTNIRHLHFSTEKDVFHAASGIFCHQKTVKMFGPFGLMGQVYEVGHFTK